MGVSMTIKEQIIDKSNRIKALESRVKFFNKDSISYGSISYKIECLKGELSELESKVKNSGTDQPGYGGNLFINKIGVDYKRAFAATAKGAGLTQAELFVEYENAWKLLQDEEFKKIKKILSIRADMGYNDEDVLMELIKAWSVANIPGCGEKEELF